MKNNFSARYSAAGLVVALTLWLIVTMQVSAQSWMQTSAPGLPPFKITLNLTATVQGFDDDGYPVDKTATTTMHWTSQSLLKIAENKLYVSFPTGASLAESDTNVVVVDATGTNVIRNLTADGLAYFTVPSGANCGSGQVNQITDAQTGSYNYIFTFSFNDGNGNSCSMTGLARDKFSMSAMDRLTGHINITETVSSTVIGDGGVGYRGAVFTGTALISGKETVTVN